MGWARTLLLGDIGNRLDIQDTERDVDSIRSQLSSVRQTDSKQTSAIGELNVEVAQLELCVSALIKTLQAKGVLDDAEVANLVDLIEPA